MGFAGENWETFYLVTVIYVFLHCVLAYTTVVVIMRVGRIVFSITTSTKYSFLILSLIYLFCFSCAMFDVVGAHL